MIGERDVWGKGGGTTVDLQEEEARGFKVLTGCIVQAKSSKMEREGLLG